MTARYYYTGNYPDVLAVVKVLSRSQRRKCKHIWCRRRHQDIVSNWASICKLCGAIARGPR